MFLPLTKIEVVESNASGKFSPRANSEGYVACKISSSPTGVKATKNIQNNFSDRDSILSKFDTHFIAFTDLVYFTRFGNERRSRCEPRWFTTLIPVNTSTRDSYPNARLYLENLPNILKDKEFISIVTKRVGRITTIGFAKPSLNIGRLPGNEVAAILRAFRHSAPLMHTLYSLNPLAASKFGALSYMQMVMGANKGTFRSDLKIHVDNFLKEKDGNIMEFIRPLMAMYYKQEMRKVPEGSIAMEAALEWASKHTLTDPRLIKERRRLLIERAKMPAFESHQCSKLLRFLNNLQTHLN